MPHGKLPIKPFKEGKGQYVAIPYAWLRDPRFRYLSADAFRVFVEMHLGFHGSNNGSIGFSVRQAAACLHSGSGRAKRAIDELEQLRFVECTRQSSFNLKTKHSREWRLTTQPMEKGPPGHDWKKITVPD